MYVHVTGANIGLSSDLHLGINRKDSDASHECHTNADCDVLVGRHNAVASRMRHKAEDREAPQQTQGNSACHMRTPHSPQQLDRRTHSASI